MNLVVWAMALLLAGDPAALEAPVTEVGTATSGRRPGWVNVVAGTRVTVFERAGAGRLTALEIVPPDDGDAAQALRLVATWDGAEKPSIDAPLRDLFGAVPGGLEHYASDLGAVGPVWSLTLPMPFGAGARIELVNDSPRDVEVGFRWRLEVREAAAAGLGRLHVDWLRRRLVAPDQALLLGTGEVMGQVAGLRLDLVASAEAGLALPLRFGADGGPDGVLAGSLSELFGTRQPAALPLAGLVLAARPEWRWRVAGYRSFAGAPLRFHRACRLTLDGSGLGEVEADLTATVFWYAAAPYPRRPEPVAYELRRRTYVGVTPAPRPSLRDLDQSLAGDPSPKLAFDTAADLKRVTILGTEPPAYPKWIDQPSAGRDQPYPGRRGLVALQPKDRDTVCRLLWKVHLPPGAARLRYAFSVDPHELQGATDVLVQLRLYDGRDERVLKNLQLLVSEEPQPDGWVTGSVPLGRLTRDEVVIVVELTPGGARGAFANEELFIDELAVTAE